MDPGVSERGTAGFPAPTASTVTKSPLQPRASACCTIFLVMARSLFTWVGVSKALSRVLRQETDVELKPLDLIALPCVDDLVKGAAG